MIKLKEIKFKNLLSTGNSLTTIQLDKADKTLILGTNGTGKCVEKSTKIDILIKNEEILKKFEEFIDKT